MDSLERTTITINFHPQWVNIVMVVFISNQDSKGFFVRMRNEIPESIKI